MKQTRRTLGVFSAALASVAFGLTGCTGASFGTELSARPKPRALRGSETKPVNLPADEPFSIVFSPSNQAPGLGGTARAEATASRDGAAEVSARVTESGTATAEFQLGHAFENNTESQVDLNVSVHFNYEIIAVGEPEARLPDAFVGLKLYASDMRNRTLRSIDLVQHSTESGDAKRRSNETVEFSITLGPGDAVNVYLAGQAKVEIKQGRSASGSLKLSGARMEVSIRPAPPVRVAGDEQG